MFVIFFGNHESEPTTFAGLGLFLLSCTFVPELPKKHASWPVRKATNPTVLGFGSCKNKRLSTANPPNTAIQHKWISVLSSPTGTLLRLAASAGGSSARPQPSNGADCSSVGSGFFAVRHEHAILRGMRNCLHTSILHTTILLETSSREIGQHHQGSSQPQADGWVYGLYKSIYSSRNPPMKLQKSCPKLKLQTFEIQWKSIKSQGLRSISWPLWGLPAWNQRCCSCILLFYGPNGMRSNLWGSMKTSKWPRFSLESLRPLVQ